MLGTMEGSRSHYVYIQLKPQCREIRLLTVLPDTPDQIPRCQLSTQTLDAIPAYNALSYVWGQPASSQAPDSVIELNGHRFPVTANLLSALRHLRPPATAQPVTLWVDAVCINQADIDERSQQVAIMREIYASAERVLIWLGEDDDSSVGVFEMIQEIATIGESDGSGNDEKKERRLHQMRKCTDFFFGLADSRPWFSRVWILQELAMARQDPLVVCGWRSVSWSDLMSVWKGIAREVFGEMGMVRVIDRPRDSNSAQQGEPTVLAGIKIDSLNDLLQTRRSHGGASLRQLLMFSRTSQATDPRDKIYALLGLLAPQETAEPPSIPIPVDYRKSTWEVYSDAMSHIFSRGQGPYFLSGMFFHGGQGIAPRVPWTTPTSLESDSLPSYLPSWVPDFTRQTAQTTTQPTGLTFHPPAHNSASGGGAECLNGYRLLDKRTLKVAGLIVDTIYEVISMGDSLAQSIQLLPRLESVTQTARHRHPCFQTNVNSLIDQFKSKEPLWRTLVCNKHSGYEEAPASYEDMYLKLLRDGKAGSDDVAGDRNEYERKLEQYVGQRVFLTTKSGFVGTCVPDGRAGDVIAIWFGSPVPFVLRATSDNTSTTSSDGQTYSLVGAAYVAGIMGGEMVDELFCEDLMDSTTFYVH